MTEKFDTQQQVIAFLRRTGDELRKTGEELRDEAQRLLAEVRDPTHQQRVRESLKEVGSWFRRTTSEATDRIEHAVKKAEVTLREGAERVRKGATGGGQQAGGKAASRPAAVGKRTGARKTPKKSASAGATKGRKKGAGRARKSPRS